MKIQAARMDLSACEEVTVARPKDLKHQYQRLARNMGIAVLFPSTLFMLVVMFVMPAQLGVVPVILASSVLHILLLMGLLSLVNALEKPLAQVLWHVAWPIHKWWMVRQASDKLRLQTQKRVVHTLNPVLVELDHEQCILHVQDAQLNLLRAHNVVLERGTSDKPTLRLRLTWTGQSQPMVLCAIMPHTLYWPHRAKVDALPQLESSAVHLEWSHFVDLMTELRPFTEGTSRNWPTLLRELCPDVHHEAFHCPSMARAA